MDSDWVKVILMIGASISISVGVTVFLLNSHEKHPHEGAVSDTVFDIRVKAVEDRLRVLEYRVNGVRVTVPPSERGR